MNIYLSNKILLLLFAFYFTCALVYGQKLPISDTLILRLNMEAQEFSKKEDWQMAASRFEEIAKIAENNFISWFNLAEAYKKDKQFRKAIEAYKNAIKFEENNFCSFWIAANYAELKDKDNTLRWLEKAEHGTLFIYPFIKNYPAFEFIYETNRFKKLMQRLEKNLFKCDITDSLRFLSELNGEFILTTPAGLEIGSGLAKFENETCFLHVKLTFIDNSVTSFKINLMEDSTANLGIHISNSFGKQSKIPLHNFDKDIIRFDKVINDGKQFKSFSISKINGKINSFRISYTYTNKDNALVLESFILIMS